MEPENPPPEEQTATPSEVWSQLDPERRARVVQLLARLAYRRITARREGDAVTSGSVTPPPDDVPAGQSTPDEGEARLPDSEQRG